MVKEKVMAVDPHHDEEDVPLVLAAPTCMGPGDLDVLLETNFIAFAMDDAEMEDED